MRLSPCNFICPACHQLVDEAVVCAFSHANTSNVLDAHAGVGHTAVAGTSAAPGATRLRWLIRCKASGKTLHPAWLAVQGGVLSSVDTLIGLPPVQAGGPASGEPSSAGSTSPGTSRSKGPAPTGLG